MVSKPHHQIVAPDSNCESVSRDTSTFPFLSLPVEIRLEIYSLLLPPRTHQIATQLPHSGSYYAPTPSTILSSLFTRTRYPIPTSAPNTVTPKLTTYILLNANFRPDFPSPSIDPAILRVCRTVHAEAEPVLYGNREARWDFGVYVEAVAPFWGDRSQVARSCVRGLRVAREIPALKIGAREGRDDRGVRDDGWETLCRYLRVEFRALRTVELTVWGEGGGVRELPLGGDVAVVPGAGGADGNEARREKQGTESEEREWREWEWTRNLLAMEVLERVSVRWWGFESVEGDKIGKFDGWLGRRMIADERVREGILAAGYVSEGVVVLEAE